MNEDETSRAYEWEDTRHIVARHRSHKFTSPGYLPHLCRDVGSALNTIDSHPVVSLKV